MHIDNVTIGEIKALEGFFSGKKNNSILKSAIGKYVIIRSINEGINAGILKDADEIGCVLSQARRLWHHKPKDSGTSWYEGVAENGLDGSSEISSAVSEKYIIEDYSVTICTEVAEASIKAHPTHGG